MASIAGDGGNNTLNDTPGDDSIFGDAGNDTITVTNGQDNVNGGADFDTLVVDYSAATADIRSLRPVAQFPSGFGGRIGDAANLEQGAQPGQRRVDYNGIEAFVITTGSGNDSIIGGSNADTISTGAGNDALDGGGGADVLRGGTGDDTYLVNTIGSIPTIEENAGEGTDTVSTSLSSFTLTAGSHVEIITGTSTLTQGLTGNELNNTINAGTGNSTLNGGGGNDILNGNSGNDTFRFIPGTATSDADVVNGGAGSDLLIADFSGSTSRVSTVIGGTGIYRYANAGGFPAPNQLSVEFFDVERVNITGSGLDDQLLGLSGDDVLRGLAGNDHLRGGQGNDTLDGGLGADTLQGSEGDDLYIVDLEDLVQENPGEGTDEVRTASSVYTLGANLETLSGLGIAAQDLRGNSLNNLVRVPLANTGANFFRLQDGGDDTAQGGAGNDAFYFGAALTAADIVDGNGGADVVALQGNYSAGLMLGASNLVEVEGLTVLTGSDARFGDTANARYSYNLTSVDANVAAGTQLTVNGSRLLSGEDFFFNGSAETDGSFLMFAGQGFTGFTGGAGNDVFVFAGDNRFNAGDRVTGAGGADILVLRGNHTVTLSFGASVAEVETVTLSSASDERFARGGGTEFDYNLTVAEDIILRAGQTMTFNGAGLMASETMIFDGSAETDGMFRLFAGASNDTLTGGGGNDLLFGGLGADTLRGGGGNDVFRYQSIAESNAGGGRDRINDFTTGDLIDLSRIDAIAGTPQNDAFTFIGEAAFTNVAGQLRFATNPTSGVRFVQGDVNGDGVADFELEVLVTNNGTLTANDFIV